MTANTQLGKPADQPALKSGYCSADPAIILSHIKAHGSHPLAMLLAVNGGEIFIIESLGAVGFFRIGSGLLVVGGAMTADIDHTPIIGAFLAWCQSEKLRPRFVHICEGTAKALADYGFNVDQLGASYSLSFEDCNLPGKQYQQVRRKLNKARREGVSVERIETLARYQEIKPHLREINRQWLKQKGTKLLKYLVCDFDKLGPDDGNRIYAAWHKEQLIAYVIFSRTHGVQSGWFHNLSRRRTNCVDGTMQLIVSQLMQDLGSGTLHFGFTPLVDLSPPRHRHSRAVSWVVNKLASLGGVVYPAASQRQYKVSWCPTDVSAEYLAYKENPLRAALWFLWATNSL